MTDDWGKELFERAQKEGRHMENDEFISYLEEQCEAIAKYYKFLSSRGLPAPLIEKIVLAFASRIINIDFQPGDVT